MLMWCGCGWVGRGRIGNKGEIGWKDVWGRIGKRRVRGIGVLGLEKSGKRKRKYR